MTFPKLIQNKKKMTILYKINFSLIIFSAKKCIEKFFALVFSQSMKFKVKENNSLKGRLKVDVCWSNYLKLYVGNMGGLGD